jgi:hypothetical protein
MDFIVVQYSETNSGLLSNNQLHLHNNEVMVSFIQESTCKVSASIFSYGDKSKKTFILWKYKIAMT